MMESNTEDHSTHISRELLLAACDGTADISLLPDNVCSTCERRNGHSAVFIAVSQKNPAVTQALLSKGYSPNIHSKTGDFALWKACFYGRLDLVEMLLHHGADINQLMCRGTMLGPNYHGRGGSVMEVAINKDRLDLARLLIQSGINVNLPDATYRCPLFNAIARGNTAIASLLLDHPRIQVNISGPHIPSPLVAAVATGTEHIIKKFVEVGVELNCFGEDVRGEPHTPLSKACQQGHVAITEFLLESGAHPNYHYMRARHMLPLHYAIKYPYQANAGLKLVKLLVQYGADVNVYNQYCESPVFMAVYLSSPNVLMHLIQNGANVAGTRDSKIDAVYWFDRRNPLELALDFGYAPIALMLAECTTYFSGDIVERIKQNSGQLGAEACEELQYKVRNPCSLRALCRGTIRNMLGGQGFKDKVDALTIPAELKGYLCFKDL